VAGDDNIGNLTGLTDEDLKRAADTFGHTLKHIHRGGWEQVDFCSLRFAPHQGERVPIPVNLKKHLFALKVKDKRDFKNTPMALSSMCNEYVFADVGVQTGFCETDPFPMFEEHLKDLDPSLWVPRKTLKERRQAAEYFTPIVWN
jgi:hypothetical protein